MTKRRKRHIQQKPYLRGILWLTVTAFAIMTAVILASCSHPQQKTVSSSTSAGSTRSLHAKAPQKESPVKNSPTPSRITTTEVPVNKEGIERPKLPTGRIMHKRRPGNYPGEISHVSSAGNKIALTFDAGASPAPTPSILNTLRAEGVHVTFFLTGRWCVKSPELVKQIVDEGHEIGNHTYSHPDLRKLSDADITAQLQKANDLVHELTGHDTRPYFRPPFGARDPRVLSVAAQDGYTSVYWSVDSWDAFKKGITSEEIKNRVLERVQAGDIVLMHCGSEATAAALPSLINDLKERGFQIVKVSELTAVD